MKTKNLLFISALSVLQIFSSCKKENIVPPLTKDKTNAANIETVSSEKTELNYLAFKTTMMTFGAIMGNVNAFKTENGSDFLSGCAVVTKDTSVFPHLITIDFGSGCTLNDGSLVTGKINATYTNSDFLTAGSESTMDLNTDTFYIGGNRILGQWTLHSNGRNVDGNSTFSMNVSNCGLIYGSDGRIIKQNVQWVSELFTNATPETGDDMISITGTSDGVTSDGDSYTDNITTPLIISRDPNCVRHFISGVTVAQITSKPDLTIDYGDGTCDTRADATQNGTTVRIQLQQY